MKKNIPFGFLIIFFVVIHFGCNNGISDEYYVRYTVDSSPLDSDPKLNIVYTNEDSNSTNVIITVGTDWQIIIGPVKKGFNTELKVSRETAIPDRITCAIWINVSENGGLFYMKKGVVGTTSLGTPFHIKYTID